MGVNPTDFRIAKLIYQAFPGALINVCGGNSNLSLINLRNTRLRTTCLYSEDSTLPRSWFAVSHKVSSKPFFALLFLVDALAMMNSLWKNLLAIVTRKGLKFAF